MGEYFPWVDTDVKIRQFGNDPARSCTARVLHAGSTTALLQLIDIVEALPRPLPHTDAEAEAARLHDTQPDLEKFVGADEER